MLSSPRTYSAVAGSCTWATVRSLATPVAAKKAPTVACRPLVDRLGLVLPSLNAPHSGCPRDPHPCGSSARVNRSPQPRAASGQPSASAIGRGMAMTSGEDTIDALSAGKMSGWSASRASSRAISIQALDAGLQTSGRGPSTASSQPRASASAAAPEDGRVTSTQEHDPATSRLAALYSPANVLTIACFSGEEATTSCVQSSRSAGAGAPSAAPPPGAVSSPRPTNQ